MKSKKDIQREEEATKRLVLKIIVLMHYGKGGQLKCCYRGCTVEDPDMLVLDHIDDDGNLNKPLGGKRRGGDGLYRYLKSKGYPAGHQTLCSNHNQQKEILRRRRKE